MSKAKGWYWETSEDGYTTHKVYTSVSSVPPVSNPVLKAQGSK